MLEMGRFVHACEGDMVYEATLAQKIPYFNSQIYFQDKVPTFPLRRAELMKAIHWKSR